MERKFYSFPDIEQFRNVIQAVQYRVQITGKDENGGPIFDTNISLPTLKFRGTVKLHGTNAGIVFQHDGDISKYVPHAQSRSGIITPTSDNAGFATFVHTLDTDRLLKNLPAYVFESEIPLDIKIYGEWCGKGIQKGVAISQINEKRFVIFAIKVGDRWISDEELREVKLTDARVYNILDYPTYEITIDFNDPKIAADSMGELVGEVEKECPVGKAFGVSGTGEGIVWMCTTEGWEGSRFWFKTKGEEHKVTKTKEKVPIDVERVNSLQSLMEIVVTEARLLQGLDYLRQQNLNLEMKNIGPFLKWVFNDVVKEELDTIVKNGFEPKDVGSPISTKARNWFIKKVDEAAGLK